MGPPSHWVIDKNIRILGIYPSTWVFSSEIQRKWQDP